MTPRALWWGDKAGGGLPPLSSTGERMQSRVRSLVQGEL
jgi:hypothetical protein